MEHNLLEEMLETATAPAPEPAPRLLGDRLRPDLAHVRHDYQRAAITGKAPGFVEGVKDALAASEQGERRDIADVTISECAVRSSVDGVILCTPRGDYPLRQHAFRQLATAAKAPGSYLAVVPGHLAIPALSWGLREHAGALSPRTLRVEGGEVRAIVSGQYAPLDDRNAYRLVYRALERAGRLDGAQIESWSVGRSSTLRVSFGEVQGPSGGGMTSRDGEGFGLRAGITVRNSEIGTGSLRISSGLWRHWCSNGCTIERLHGASWSRRHTGDWAVQAAELAAVLDTILAVSDRVLRDAVPGAAADIYDVDALQARLRKIKVTRADRAAIAREALAEACGQYRFTPDAMGEVDERAREEASAVFEALQRRRLEDEADEVIATLRSAPEVNGWHLVNGVTAVARQHAEEGRDDRAAELEALGGSILASYLN